MASNPVLNLPRLNSRCTALPRAGISPVSGRTGDCKVNRPTNVEHLFKRPPFPMKYRTNPHLVTFACLAFSLGALATTSAQPGSAPATVSENGRALEQGYARLLAELQAAIKSAIPVVDPRLVSDFQRAGDASKKAQASAKAANEAHGKIGQAKALVEHAKGKWIGGADKGIATAETALKNAKTETERKAARADLEKWKKNKEDGLAALKERQAAYDQLKREEPALARALESAKAAAAEAKENEMAASRVLVHAVGTILNADTLDLKLVKLAVLQSATPRGLANFAESRPDGKDLIDSLLGNTTLMKSMLEAGGAKFGEYGRAMEILSGIRQVANPSGDPVLHRLALATSLEHARPITQNNIPDAAGAPSVVDPIKRYQHYEKAYLAGELDPAFRNLTAWEMRHVVNSDAPDEILAWGREMLRTYRPDHIYNPDYGWRYVSSVRTEVSYGSQNVKDDLPSLHQFQNIMMNGGVCGRRAFFGRFILRSFGIPTWGVTQKAHAALSHWTPKGWVVNLGAGFESSWWDKDEAPRSGSDFLLETQARAHGPGYLPVLRARWVSMALGEESFNDRKGVEGGVWSRLARLKTVDLAATAVTLGPLGKELAEANEAGEKQMLGGDKVTEQDKQIVVKADGTIIIPAVAHGKTSGRFAAMKSFGPGMQVHATAGYKGEILLEIPATGTYLLSAKVATVHGAHDFAVTATGTGVPIAIPLVNTVGKWRQTAPVELTMQEGANSLVFEVRANSKGVTIKEYHLVPRK